MVLVLVSVRLPYGSLYYLGEKHILWLLENWVMVLILMLILMMRFFFFIIKLLWDRGKNLLLAFLLIIIYLF